MISHEACPEDMAVIVAGKIVTGCELCIGSKKQRANPSAAKYHRDMDRRDHAKDIVQPNQPWQYVKAYGADKAREAGYREDQIRKYG